MLSSGCSLGLVLDYRAVKVKTEKSLMPSPKLKESAWLLCWVENFLYPGTSSRLFSNGVVRCLPVPVDHGKSGRSFSQTRLLRGVLNTTIQYTVRGSRADELSYFLKRFSRLDGSSRDLGAYRVPDEWTDSRRYFPGC